MLSSLYPRENEDLMTDVTYTKLLPTFLERYLQLAKITNEKLLLSNNSIISIGGVFKKEIRDIIQHKGRDNNFHRKFSHSRSEVHNIPDILYIHFFGEKEKNSSRIQEIIYREMPNLIKTNM